MKTLRFALLLAVVGIGSAAADDILRIEIGRQSGASQEDQARRIYFLERAVYQLQNRVYNLEGKPAEPDKSQFSTCLIKTPFNGTFSATEPTETAARADALEKCAKATDNNSVFCNEEKLKCGK